MDADNNPSVSQVAADESALDEQLRSDFDELSESIPGDGAGGNGDTEPADDTDDGSSLEDSVGDTDEGDGDPGETDDDAGQGENANDVPDAAGEGEPSEKSVDPEPPKIDRKAERLRKEIEKYAKDNGYDSVEDMIGTSTGETADEVKKRLDSEDLTVEEKAALYDAEHAKSKEAERADAERRGREAVLQALYADFPTIKDTVKDLDKDIKNPDRFLKLLLAGNTPREAFLATGNVPPRSAPVPNGKSHLVPDIRAKRSGGTVSIPASELAYLRDQFPDLSDKEIEEYWKRVSS